MDQEIRKGLSKIGDDSSITKINKVSGGDINSAFYVETENQQYFIKGNTNVPSNFFQVEAHGLYLIDETNTIKVPHVYYFDEPKFQESAIMIMDWVEGTSIGTTEKMLGEKLALMHQHHASQYGFDGDTFVGVLPQANQLYSNWLDYYKNERLLHHLNIGIERGRMPGYRRKKLEKLINQLDKWIAPYPKASLLHGDLWGGNWLVGTGGEPYLIDPSVLYGDPAFELAFTELFGGFSTTFYEAYQEINPLPAHYEEVKELYQLFYLLVHLNIFGESYGGAVDRILSRYT